MYSSNPLPTLPLWGEIRPTVVKSCLDLSCGGIFYSGFIYSVNWGFERAGGRERCLEVIRAMVCVCCGILNRRVGEEGGGGGGDS